MKTLFHTREEELALIGVAQAGHRAEARQEAGSPAPFDEVAVKLGLQARNTLIETNYGFILGRCNWFAEKYEQRVRRGELVYSATTGYINAINHYDARKGTRLSTYAKWWIFNQIQNELEGDSRRARHRHMRDMVSIDYRVHDMLEEMFVQDDLGGEEQVAYVIEKIRAAIAELPANWQDAVKLRLDGMSHIEIAKALKYSRQRSHQILHKASKRLAESLEPIRDKLLA